MEERKGSSLNNLNLSKLRSDLSLLDNCFGKFYMAILILFADNKSNNSHKAMEQFDCRKMTQITVKIKYKRAHIHHVLIIFVFHSAGIHVKGQKFCAATLLISLLFQCSVYCRLFR